METHKNMIYLALGLVVSAFSLNLYARAEKPQQGGQESRDVKAAAPAGQEMAAARQEGDVSSRPESSVTSNPKSKWQSLRENRGMAARQIAAAGSVSQQGALAENTPAIPGGGSMTAPGRSSTDSTRIFVKTDARVYAQRFKRDSNAIKKGQTQAISAKKSLASAAGTASQADAAIPQETPSLMILSGDKGTPRDIRKSAIKKLADRASADKSVQTQLVQIAHDTTEEQSVRQGAIEAFTDGTTGRTRLAPNSQPGH